MPLSLIDACRDGSLSSARRSIRRGDSLAQTDDGGYSPLLRAIANNHIAIVKILLKNGADTSQTTHTGYTALLIACTNGFVKIVQLLLDHGIDDIGQAADNGTFALFAACCNGFENCAQLLLESGANMNQVQYKGWSPLHGASFNGYVDLARLLLERGANVEADMVGRTPSQLASLQGHDAIVDLLSEHAAAAVREDEASLVPREGGDSETAAALEPRLSEGGGSETAAALEPRLSQRPLAKRVYMNCGERAPLSAPKPQKCGGYRPPRTPQVAGFVCYVCYVPGTWFVRGFGSRLFRRF